jgi:hypothetical protein
MADQRRDQQSMSQQGSSRQQRQSASGGRQQQAGQGSAGQQQQFDTGSGQQGGGGSGSEGSLAAQIRPHQEVVDESGVLIGTVDHIDGDRIKLTRGSSGDGEHHYVPLSQVAGMQGDRIRLRERGDNSFGQQAGA